MKNGFVKVAVASPEIRVADPAANLAELLRLSARAADEGVRVLVFPELCITGYTCGDLLTSQKLIADAAKALSDYIKGTAGMDLLSVVGVPLMCRNKLYNCAAFCRGGKLLGVTPKTYLPNYSEFSEVRHFATLSPYEPCTSLSFDGEEIPFGTRLLFSCREVPALKVAAEICEDIWVPIPPSTYHTSAGATLICNLSASNDTVGKADYRRQLVTSQSGKTLSAYLYASSGRGESTTDVVFGGHGIICENGEMIAERKPFDFSDKLLVTEIDLERILHERRRINTYAIEGPYGSYGYREIPFSVPFGDTALTRPVDPHPFVPADPQKLEERCETILTIQSEGLCQRIRSAGAKKLVVGISGGLDSTLALLVSVRALKMLGRPASDVIAVTMPCFGTTARTKGNATVLCEKLGTDFRCVNIFDAVNQHFRDIGHDPEDRNVTYENSQARERTQVLMDLANDCGGMVIGTGDLSELALGWATYNGDHMSMYGVNASVPKTLLRHIIAHCAAHAEDAELAATLTDILNTPVSPELLPADQGGNIAQKTEDLVGPYELHDFFLYYTVRRGDSPAKIYRLARKAFDGIYDDETIRKWLRTFLRRFFTQQFKRSCLPDGPKVGSVDLSPRGDWQMPSDASFAAWCKEAEEL